MFEFRLSSKFLDTLDESKMQFGKTVEGEEIKWSPLLTLTFDFAPNRIIGITDKGYWISQWNNGVIEKIDSRDKCYNLLICLEMERSKFENLLQEAILAQNIEPGILSTFPIVELIKFSLISKTSWSTNAAFWLREEDMDKELEEITTDFINNKHFSQEARHRLFRILKRWQRIQFEKNASC